MSPFRPCPTRGSRAKGAEDVVRRAGAPSMRTKMHALFEFLGPAGLAFAGAVLVAVAGLWAASHQRALERELRAKAEEIAELNKRVVEKSEEIVALNRKIVSSVTGGDSFCYLDFTRTLAAITDLFLVHQGKHALFDLTVRVVDVEKFKSIVSVPGLSLRDVLQTDALRQNVGTLIPSSSITLSDRWPLPASDRKDYNVFFSARNGFFIQLLRLRRINGVWLRALRVTRDNDKGETITLLEKIDDGYPRDKAGQIEW